MPIYPPPPDPLVFSPEDDEELLERLRAEQAATGSLLPFGALEAPPLPLPQELQLTAEQAAPATPAQPAPPLPAAESVVEPPLPFDAARDTLAQIESQDAQLARLRARRSELAGAFAGEEDEARRQSLLDRATAIGGAERDIADARRQAALRAEEQIATGEAETRAELQRQRVKTLEAAQARIRHEGEHTAAQVADLQQAETEARDALAGDREAYRKALRGRENTGNWGVLLASMVGEALTATAERRPVNVGPIVDRWQRRNDQLWQDGVNAALDRVAEGQDRVTQLARQQQAAEQQRSAQEVAILTEAERDLMIQAERAQSEIDQMTALTAADAVRQRRAAAQAEALAKGRELALRVRKDTAEARLKEAQAAKLERGLRGGPGAPAPTGAAGAADAFQVRLPGTSEVLADYSGDKRLTGSQKLARAKGANELIGAHDSFIRTVAEYKAAVKDYGERGLLDSAAFIETPEFAALEARRQKLVDMMAKIISGGVGTIQQAERDAAEDRIRLPEGWWRKSGTTIAKLEEFERDAQETFRAKAAEYLAQPAIERYLDHRAARSKSQAEAATEFADQATRTATDPKAVASKRVAAVRTIVDTAKQQADRAGNSKDWVFLAIPRLLDVRQRSLATAGDKPDAAGRAAGEAKTFLLDIGRTVKERLDGLERAGELADDPRWRANPIIGKAIAERERLLKMKAQLQQAGLWEGAR